MHTFESKKWKKTQSNKLHPARDQMSVAYPNKKISNKSETKILKIYTCTKQNKKFGNDRKKFYRHAWKAESIMLKSYSARKY